MSDRPQSGTRRQRRVLRRSGYLAVVLSVLGALAPLTVTAASAAAPPTPVGIAVGTSPLAVAADPVTDMVYVANSDSFLTRPGTVSVIDGKQYISGQPNTGKVVATVHVGRSPWGIAVDPNTDTVYVADTGSNAVTVIDGHDNKVIATIGVGARPTGIGVIPATDLIYVANGGNGKLPGTVSVIDGHRNKVVGSVAVGYDPFGIGVNTISHVVYVGNQGGKGPSTGYAGTVSVIRGTDVDATVTVGGSPFGIGVDSLTNNVYVANYTEGEGDSNVALINGASRLVSQIPLTNPDPEGVTVDQTTHAVFVANSYSGSATGPIGSLSVINGATNAEILSVNVGGNPWGITADPTTDRVYLANDTSPGTVSEVDFRGYPMVGGTPPPTIPTTTTTTPASLAGTLCGLIVKSGAMKTLGLTGSYFVAKNHSVVVPAYGQCEIEQVPPSGHVSLTGVALLYVSDSIPPTAAVPEKPVTGMGAGAAIYTGSEIPCVVWHHGKKFVALEFSWSEEVEASRINAKAPALIAAARQVYALYH